MHKCENCGIEFDWQTTIVDGAVFCCLGCSQGGPCSCDYSRLPNGTDRASLVVRGDNPPGGGEQKDEPAKNRERSR